MMELNEVKNLWGSEKDCIIVVYDNKEPPNQYNSLGLKKGWGFSAAIRYHGKRILFDAGWSNSIELNNLNCLNIPNQFDYIVVSHRHWDHMGALSAIVENNPESIVYLPDDFSNNLTRETTEQVKRVYRLSGSKGPVEIVEGLYVTGDTKGYGDTGEQSLVIKGAKYNLLVVGCLHPGLKPLVRLASKKLVPNAIIGGIHGFKDTEYLESTELRNLFIGHCTQHLDLFKNLPGIYFEQIYPGFALEL